MNKQVLCFGEVLWDTFGDEQKPGGAPMNVALHLKKQGVNTSLLSRVGNDAAGRELSDFLKQQQLYSGLIQVDEKLPTCKVGVELDEQLQATYTIPKPVSWDCIQNNEMVAERVEHISVIVFGSLACRCKTSRNTLLDLFEHKMLKVFDVNLRHPHYEQSTIQTLAAIADVIKMNEEEANQLLGSYNEPLKDKILEFQRKFHSQTICVTRGENGAIVWHDEKFYEHPGFNVEVVDTVGAGDAFLATFIAGLLNKQAVEQLLERACAVGAYVATQRGANPDYDEACITNIIKSMQVVA